MNPERPLKVAVVIVTWNAAKWAAGCFGTLAKIDAVGLEVEIVVSDNGSADGTPAMVRAACPAATVIENGRNLGFAEGNNVGIRRALERGADYVYLLNQDTEVRPDFLKAAVAAAEADPKAGSVQSLLVLHPETGLINSSGNVVHWLGLGYCRDYRRPLAGWRPPADREIAYASGAGVLYRAAALRQVGLLDADLYLYHEDLELGWRLRLAGWRNILAPDSVVWHKYEFSRSVSKLFWMERNRFLVLFKCLRAWSLAVLFPWLLLSEIGLFAAAIKGGWWREKFKVYRYLFSREAWRKISDDRRAVSALRTVPDRKIVRLFAAAIEHQETEGFFTRYVANPLMRLVWALVRPLIV